MYLLNALALHPRAELSAEDASVSGVWEVFVDSNVPPHEHADAVLDIFHSHVAVRVLDDFHFSVVNPQSGLVVQPSAAPAYTHQDSGCVQGKRQGQPLCVATYRVRGEGEGDGLDLGEVTVCGQDASKLDLQAIDLLWDERLRSASLHPAAYLVDEYLSLPAQPEGRGEQAPARGRQRG